ncbi:MAG: hypothetical protein HOO99_09450 [Hyphomicrobiaceae bacterium]|nr:hypothetical protein [Hyphomicrobiaceae bacterium]
MRAVSTTGGVAKTDGDRALGTVTVGAAGSCPRGHAGVPLAVAPGAPEYPGTTRAFGSAGTPLGDGT